MKNISRFVSLFTLCIFIACASVIPELKFLEEPKENTILIIGNVIVENINQGLRVADVEGISSESIGKIFIQKSTEGLKNKQFWNQGYVYTRPDPLEHLKQKFPESGWWKL